MKKKFLSSLVLTAAVITLAACGGGGTGGGTVTTTALKGLAACTPVGGEGVICGTVLAPDGLTPIVNAEIRLVTAAAQTVTLKGLVVGDFNKLAANENGCFSDAAGAFACSGITQGGTQQFQFTGGGYTKSWSSNIIPGEVTNVPTSDTTATAGSSTLRVVVSTGMWDSIQDVIKRVFKCDTSVTDGDYTGPLTIGNECPIMEIVEGGDGSTWGATNPNTALTNVLGLAAGTYPTIEQLLASPQGLALFDIVLINCTSGDPATLTNATYHTNLQQYVSDGGNVYASDRSGDYIEQTWPQYIEWHGTTPGDGLTATPEPLNQGWDSSSGTQLLMAQDPGLLAWMQGQGWTSGAANNEFNVTFIGGEMIQQQVASGVTTLIDAASIIGIGDLPIAGKTSVPVSVSFPSGSGCVFYTTFHSENDSTVPQERVLDYFLQNKVNNCS